MGPEQEATVRGQGDPSGMPDRDRQCAGSRGLLEGALGPWVAQVPLPNPLSQAAVWLLCTAAGKKLLGILPQPQRGLTLPSTGVSGSCTLWQMPW